MIHVAMSFGAILPTLPSSGQISWKNVHFVRLTALQDDAATNDYLEWPCYLFASLKELITTVLPRDSIPFWTGIEPQEESSHPLTLSPQDFRHDLFLNMAHSLWIEECLAEVADADGSKKSPEYPIAYLFADLPPACDCYHVVTPELESQLVPFAPHVERIVSAASTPSCVPAIRQAMQVFQQAACPWLPPRAAAAAAAAATAALLSGAAKHGRYAVVPRGPAASRSSPPRRRPGAGRSVVPVVSPATKVAAKRNGAATSTKLDIFRLSEATIPISSALPSEEPTVTHPTHPGTTFAASDDAAPLSTVTTSPPAPAAGRVAKITPDGKSCRKRKATPPVEIRGPCFEV
jgi:hypothetical protein